MGLLSYCIHVMFGITFVSLDKDGESSGGARVFVL